MEFSELLENLQSQEEQLSPNLQKCVSALSSAKELKSKRISFTYNVLTTVAIERLSNGITISEYQAGIYCITHILGIWKDFNKIVKKHQIGNIIYKFIAHCKFELTKKTLTAVKLYSKYVYLDNSYDENVLKWIIKKLSTIEKPNIDCKCKTDKSNCQLLTYSKLKIHGFILRSFVFDKKPLNIVNYLNSHLHEIISTKTPCCHLANLSGAIKNLLEKSECWVITKVHIKAIHDFFELMKTTLQLHGSCKNCGESNYALLLKKFNAVVNKMFLYKDEIDENTVTTFYTHGINQLLFFMNACVKFKDLLLNCEEKVVLIMSSLQNLLKFFPSFTEAREFKRLVNTYLPRCLNNLLVVIITSYANFDTNESACDPIALLCEDILSVSTHSDICDNVLLDNIKKTLKLLCHTSHQRDINSVIDDVIVYILSKNMQYDMSKLVEIRTFWLSKYCKNKSVCVTFLFNNLMQRLPLECLVKVLKSEIYFYHKYKLIQHRSVNIPNSIIALKKYNSENMRALLDLTTSLYSWPLYFNTKTSTEKICSGVLEKLRSSDENWELLIWAKYLKFLSVWQATVKNDFSQTFNEPQCKQEAIVSVTDILECSTIAQSQLQPDKKLEYPWQTCNLIISIANLVHLHGHFLTCEKLLAKLCEYLLLQDLSEESTLFSLVMTAVECGNVNFQLNISDSVAKYFEVAKSNFSKYEKLFITTKRKHCNFVKISLKLLECKCMYLKEDMENAFSQLAALASECKAIEMPCTKEWFLSQINFIRSKICPYLYDKQNVDYKIMPLKECLSSLFSINVSNNGLFKEIFNKTFSKTDIPVFDESNNPIIPFENSESVDIIIAMQVNAIIELLNVCYEISKFYLLSGDLETVHKYLPTGMHLSKRLKLYGQTARFLLLYLQVSCEGNAETDNETKAVQEELEIIKFSKTCNQKTFDRLYSNALPRELKTMTIPESQPHPEDKEVVVDSSDEDDSFVIKSTAIEGLDDVKKSETKSSPTFKRKKVIYRLPDIGVISHVKNCKCDLCSDMNIICLELQLGFCIVKTLLDKNEDENALMLCNKILDKMEPIKKFCDENHTVILNMLAAQALLYKCIAVKEDHKLCSEILDEINSYRKTLPLSDNLHCKTNLISCKMSILPFKNSFTREAINLEDIINSNAGIISCVTPSTPKLLPPSTPAPRKIPRDITNSIKQSRSIKKTKASTKKNDCGNINTFDIFNEEAPDVKIKAPLPKPNLNVDEDLISGVKELTLKTAPVKKKSRRRIVIADSSSDEDSFVTLPEPKKSPPNIMKTRRTAAARNRRKNGPVYTEKSPERTRGVRKQHAVRKVGNQIKSSSVGTEKVSQLQSPACANADGSLMDVLRASIRLDDILTVKECLQLLSDHHYYLYCQTSSKESLYTAVCFHLISVGVSYRGQSHYYMQQTCKTVNTAHEYKNWLQNAVKVTHPRKLLSTIDDPISYVKNSTQHIPSDWVVCTISFVRMPDKDHLLLTRTMRNSTPIHVQLTDTTTASILDDFSEILANNAFSIKNVKDKSTWWTNRRDYNRDIKNLLRRIEDYSLSFMKGMLCGKPVDESRCAQLEKEAKVVAKYLQITTTSKIEFLKIILDTWSKLNTRDKAQAIEFLCSGEISKIDRAKAVAYIADKFKNTGKIIKRHHVVLVLDKQIQGFPWENIPLLYQHPITRMPSYETLILQLQLMNCLNNSVAAKGVDMNTVSYILNPAKDLMATENRFREWFESAESWKGIVSRPPTTKEWIECITNYDLFIYTGHGSGSKYVHSNTISKLQGRAASFIMGCSSGALKEYGAYEPSGPVLAYLIAGIPCVLSCLWTVTDKDIDRFLAKIISTWACSVEQEENLAECMHVASSSCNMKWLNGAACVIYGLPVNCQVKMQKLLDSLPEIFNT